MKINKDVKCPHCMENNKIEKVTVCGCCAKPFGISMRSQGYLIE